jgi:hypothetical protein
VAAAASEAVDRQPATADVPSSLKGDDDDDDDEEEEAANILCAAFMDVEPAI